MVIRSVSNQKQGHHHFTEGLDFCSTLVDLKRDPGLVKKHAEGDSCQSCADNEDSGPFWVHDRAVVLKSDSWVDLHGDVGNERKKVDEEWNERRDSEEKRWRVNVGKGKREGLAQKKKKKKKKKRERNNNSLSQRRRGLFFLWSRISF